MKRSLRYLLALFCFVFSLEAFADDVIVEAGRIRILVDDYGSIRIWITTATDTIRQFDRASVLVSGNQYQVVDYWNDIDTVEYNRLLTNPTFADYEVYAVLDNNFSGEPPNVLIYQTVYVWNDAEYVVVKMKVVNNESGNLPTRVGLDITGRTNGTYENDSLYFNTSNNILYSYDSSYVGFKLFSPALGSARVFEWFEDYENSDTNYYNMLTSDIFDTDLLVTDADGSVSIIGTQSFNLAPGDSVIVFFGIAVGQNNAELIDNINDAEERYNDIVASVSLENNLIPEEYTLKQNYPNPFNPVTNINFSIPETEFVNLTVYNLLGEAVAELVNNELTQGNYTYEFDASKLTSGIYFYTVTAGNYSESKKMILMK